jgi:hypothetical protein
LWLAVPLAAVTFFALKNFKPFNPRYVMVAYPAYVLLVARGLRWPEGARFPRKLVSGALAAMILVSTAVSLGNLYHAERYWKDDFRSAAAALTGRLEPGDVVFTEGTYEPLLYYGRGKLAVHPLFPELVSDQAVLLSFVSRKAEGAGRVWLVTSRLWNLDPERKVLRLFERTFSLEEEFNFEGVDVFLFRKNPETQHGEESHS